MSSFSFLASAAASSGIVARRTTSAVLPATILRLNSAGAHGQSIKPLLLLLHVSLKRETLGEKMAEHHAGLIIARGMPSARTDVIMLHVDRGRPRYSKGRNAIP